MLLDTVHGPGLQRCQTGPPTGNVFVLTDGKSGRELDVVPNDDGVLIALLIPAVQGPRSFVPAHGASVQLFDTDGFTRSFELFFDSYE